MNTVLFSATVFCAFIPLITIFTLTPYLSRKGSCFGVMLIDDAQKSYKIRMIKRAYSTLAVVGGVCVGGICYHAYSYSFLAAGLGFYCAACLLLYMAANSAMKNIVMSENYENFQKELNLRYIPVQGKNSAVSLWWQLLHLPLLGAMWWISPGGDEPFWFVLPLVQCAVAVLIFALHLLIRRASHYACKKEVERSLERNQRFRRAWTAFVLGAGLLCEGVLLVIQYGTLRGLSGSVYITAAPFAMTLLITGGAIFIAWRHNKQ